MCFIRVGKDCCIVVWGVSEENIFFGVEDWSFGVCGLFVVLICVRVDCKYVYLYSLLMF